jgi:hypothetical protein
MKLVVRILLVLVFPALMVTTWLFVPQFLEGVQVEKSDTNSELVSVEPLPLKIYCPGPLVEVGGEQGTELGSLELIGKSQISSYSSNADLLQSLEVEVLNGGSIESYGFEQSTGSLAANQVQSISRARAIGLAATNCPQPQSYGWFATGVSGSGNESVLLMANPNQTEAQVNLEFRLPERILEHRVTLAANESAVLSLAAFSDAAPNYAIRYYTDGPKVSLALQNRSARGLTATGIELQSPVLELSSSYVITGLSTYAVGFEAPTLIIANPSAAELRVSVTAVGENAAGLETTVVVPNGAVISTSLNLPQGSFTLFLDSNAEFLAAVRNTALEPVLDFAWVTPAQKFNGLLVLPLSNLESRLFLANDEDQAVSITIESVFQGGSEYQTVSVPANSGVSLKVSAETLRLQSGGGFYAALEILDIGGYAIIKPRENRNLGAELMIEVR